MDHVEAGVVGPGLLVYIMVKDLVASLDAILEHGGKLEPLGPDAPATIARFRDPAGNVLGLYQDPSLSKPVK